eukprot:920845-Amphidinium_carterae.1
MEKGRKRHQGNAKVQGQMNSLRYNLALHHQGVSFYHTFPQDVRNLNCTLRHEQNAQDIWDHAVSTASGTPRSARALHCCLLE